MGELYTQTFIEEIKFLFTKGFFDTAKFTHEIKWSWEKKKIVKFTRKATLQLDYRNHIQVNRL